MGRWRAGAARAARAAVCLVAGVVGPIGAGGCVSDRVAASRSPVTLIVERLAASPGGRTDDASRTFLQSDVVTDGRAVSDVAEVTLRLGLKDPGPAAAPSAPTRATFVTVTRYHVRYVRSDGRDRPGIDVPAPWTGALTMTLGDGAQTGEFVIVRAAAKLEPPLRALRAGGGAVVIDTMAEVTWVGHDQTGVPVTASGLVSVHFADWVDAGVPLDTGPGTSPVREVPG